MGDFNRRSVAVSGPPKSRARFAELGDRLAGAFATPNQRQSDREHSDVNGSVDEEPFVPWDHSPGRFPIVREGYDRPAVDHYVAELEQELTALDREIEQLREKASSGGEVRAEIERVGEQTSAVLIAAHEQAHQTTRLAQEEADNCIANAAAKALAMTSDAKEQLRELGHEKESLIHQRERLISDVRRLSAAMTTVADDADQRFAPEAADQPLGPEAAESSTAGD